MRKEITLNLFSVSPSLYVTDELNNSIILKRALVLRLKDDALVPVNYSEEEMEKLIEFAEMVKEVETTMTELKRTLERAPLEIDEELKWLEVRAEALLKRLEKTVEAARALYKELKERGIVAGVV